MRFIVVIPVRNISNIWNEYLSRNLNLLQEENVNTVVVDNLSSDNTLELIAPYESRTISIIRNERDGGFAYSLNEGFDYGLSKEFHHYLVCSADVILSKPLLKFLSEKDFFYDYLSFSKRLSQDLTISRVKQPLSAAVFMLSRNAIRKVGYFDESYYLYGEDNDYHFRLMKAGSVILNCEIELDHKGQSYSANNENSDRIVGLCYRNYLLFAKKNIGFHGYVFFIFKLMRYVFFGSYLIDSKHISVQRLISGSVISRYKHLKNAILETW